MVIREPVGGLDTVTSDFVSLVLEPDKISVKHLLTLSSCVSSTFINISVLDSMINNAI